MVVDAAIRALLPATTSCLHSCHAWCNNHDSVELLRYCRHLAVSWLELLCDLFLPVIQSQADWEHDSLATRIFRDRFDFTRQVAAVSVCTVPQQLVVFYSTDLLIDFLIRFMFVCVLTAGNVFWSKQVIPLTSNHSDLWVCTSLSSSCIRIKIQGSHRSPGKLL